MSNKQILFLTHQLPFPPNSGGVIKSWKYLEFLCSNYDVGLACLLKEGDSKYEEELKSKINLIDYYSEFLDKPRTYFNIVKGLLFANSINSYRNYSKNFKDKITSLSKNYNILIIDHIEMHQYIPFDFKGNVIMHTHNAEFMLWQRMSELEKSNPIKKLLLRYEANRVKKIEKEFLNKSDLIFTTPSDKAIYEKAGLSVSKCRNTFHLGHDQLLNLPNIEFENTDCSLTFIGTMNWEPNIDGLYWFITQVFPSIKKKRPEVKLYVLGSNVDSRILELAEKDSQIILTGFVKDLDTYLKITRVYIVPLRFGSGMKVKVLDGLYRGIPMVSTPIGVEGIKVTNNQNILLADNPKQFSDYCIQLLSQQATWERFRDESRKLAEDNYLWKDNLEAMDKELKSIL